MLKDHDLVNNLPFQLYFLGVKYGLGIEPERLRLLYLRYKEESIIEGSQINFDTLENNLKKVVQEIRDKQGNDFQPNPNNFCSFCEFRILCPQSNQKSITPLNKQDQTIKFIKKAQAITARIQNKTGFKKLLKNVI